MYVQAQVIQNCTSLNRGNNLYDWFHQKEQLSALLLSQTGEKTQTLGYFTLFTILHVRMLFFAASCFKVKAEKSIIVRQIQHRKT